MYNALHSNDGQLVAAVADMDIFDAMDSSKVKNTHIDYAAWHYIYIIWLSI